MADENKESDAISNMFGGNGIQVDLISHAYGFYSALFKVGFLGKAGKPRGYSAKPGIPEKDL